MNFAGYDVVCPGNHEFDFGAEKYAQAAQKADFSIVCANIATSNDLLAKIIQPYVFNINLVGTHGTIKNNRLFSKKKLPGQTSWAEIPTVLPDSGDVTHHPFSHEVEHLLGCIETDTESHCSVADAYITHEVCLAADISGKEGKPVTLPLK